MAFLNPDCRSALDTLLRGGDMHHTHLVFAMPHPTANCRHNNCRAISQGHGSRALAQSIVDWLRQDPLQLPAVSRVLGVLVTALPYTTAEAVFTLCSSSACTRLGQGMGVQLAAALRTVISATGCTL